MPEAGKSDGRLVFDCLSAVLLLLVAVLGAYMPKYLASKGSLQQGTASSLAFHLGNMLSGGVMLSAGFCHLLADALRQLAFVGRFPIAPFLAATGYLITLLADQIVQLLTTDAEDKQQRQQQLMSPDPGFASDQGFGRAESAGFRPSPVPAAAAAAPAAGNGFTNMFRGGLGRSAWGYSRLEELPQVQQQQGSSSLSEGPGIELSGAHGNGFHSIGDRSKQVQSAETGAGVEAAASVFQEHCGDYLPGCTSYQQQQPSLSCCHNPATCPCCIARGSQPDSGTARALNPSSSMPLNPAAGQLGGQGSAGFTRRPGSAGGLARAGLGLGTVAGTRSLTSPNGVGPSLSPLQAAAAGELGGTVGAVPAGFAPFEAAAAATGEGPVLHVSLPVSTGIPSSGDAAAGAAGSDDATCLLAAGSPRSVSAGGLHPRSPKVKPASGLIHQQQQQQAHAASHRQQQQQQAVPLPLHQQQQQPGPLLPDGLQRSNSSITQLLMQPVRQLSIPACSCCCGGGGCRSALPSAQPDMTEACAVARFAGHLELEVMSTTTGGHNHGHFQVFLSHRPLSFATSLLLACALCIHSILEGLALGAQQSMQATEDIMLAIAAHKGLAAYALGASIVESGASDSKFWVVVGLFAAATPLGIAIGYASSVLGHGPVSAAMSALASGTFLYVALNEVIPKELEHPDGHRLAKVAALLLGFGLMSLLAVWA